MEKEKAVIDVEQIPVGTDVAFAHAPEERWRVVGPSEAGRFDFPSYRCEPVGWTLGDFWAKEQNEDGTIDMDGGAIVAALGAA